MDINYFQANLSTPAILIPAIKKEWKSYFEWKAFQQYDPMFHDIVKKRGKRPDKTIQVPSPGGELDPVTGNPVNITKTVYLSRIPLALQRLIVSRACAFLTGGKIELKSKPATKPEETLYELVKKTWRNNKLNYKNSDIAKRFMSETECAEIWYSKKNEDGSISMKCNIYSPSKGYDLIPVFDNQCDLIAFGLGYKSKTEKGDRQHMDIYTAEKLIRNVNEGNGWAVADEIELLYGKIPVIYYNLEQAIWADVQVMIDRLETLISNFADTNDYNGSPILAARGEIRGFSAKGETGKVIELVGDNAELKYVNWDNAPESIKLEIETLLDFIYTITQTPNISFKEMKGLGDISGVAFDRMMIDAHLKATDLQNGMYGECIQRRLNFLISACVATNPGLDSAIDLEMAAEFSLFSIDDVNERITNAKLANGGKPVLDQKESIKMAGLTDDPEATYEAIIAEQAVAAQQLAESQQEAAKKAIIG